jgi:ABC-type Na+ efflux pump permease subunit
MPFGSKKKQEDFSEIERQKEALQAQINELQSFIKEAPEKLQQEEQERLQTMPAPDELTQRRRENDFSNRLTKGELKNERRHQARSALLFVLLVAAIISVSLWVYRIIAESA